MLIMSLHDCVYTNISSDGLRLLVSIGRYLISAPSNDKK